MTCLFYWFSHANNKYEESDVTHNLKKNYVISILSKKNKEFFLISFYIVHLTDMIDDLIFHLFIVQSICN